MTETTIQSRTLTKYRELNDHLRDFLKNLLLMEKSSSDKIDQRGIPFLNVKNDLLLHYLINLVALMSRRSTPNQSLTSEENRRLVLRLCEIRTSLEKIRPIEQKLKYQIDKMLKNHLDEHLTYRARPENFDRVDDDEEEEEEGDGDDDGQKEKQTKVYRPPKLVPMEMPEDLQEKDSKDNERKRREHLQRRAFHSDIFEDFKRKYSDAPEEVYHTDRSRLLQKSRTYKERIAYEEEYFKRLPQTKRERQQYQRILNGQADDVIDHLHDADVLLDENLPSNSKKKKGKLSRKSKKRLQKNKTKSVKRLKSRK